MAEQNRPGQCDWTIGDCVLLERRSLRAVVGRSRFCDLFTGSLHDHLSRALDQMGGDRARRRWSLHLSARSSLIRLATRSDVAGVLGDDSVVGVWGRCATVRREVGFAAI